MKLQGLILTMSFVFCAPLFADDVDPILPGPPGKAKIAKFSIVPIDDVFIPGGFDDNDVTEVVLKGTLPNSCWKVGSPNTKFDKSTNTYKLSVTSFVLEGQICLPVTSTFVESVKLGVLSSGTYSIEAKTTANDLIAKSLNVKPAGTDASDNFLYAQVESIQLVKEGSETTGYEIQGRVPPMAGKCLVFENLEPEFDSENVLTYLPVLKEGEASRCTAEEILNGRTFTTKQKFKGIVSDKSFLIHARSLNGQSVNRFVPAE